MSQNRLDRSEVGNGVTRIYDESEVGVILRRRSELHLLGRRAPKTCRYWIESVNWSLTYFHGIPSFFVGEFRREATRLRSLLDSIRTDGEAPRLCVVFGV